MNTPSDRPTSDEWVAWFEADGFAHHYPADSARGRWILEQLAALTAPVMFCSAPKSRTRRSEICGKPIWRRGQKFCSTACRNRAWQAEPAESPDRRQNAETRRISPSGPPPTGTPKKRLIATLPPGETRTDKRDTASRICEWCGGEYEPRRAGGRFCSDTCRQAAHRAGLRQLELQL